MARNTSSRLCGDGVALLPNYHDSFWGGGGKACQLVPDRNIVMLKGAIEREKSESCDALKGTGLEDLAGVRFEEVQNGEKSLILD